MKAIRIHGRGGPDHLVYEDAPQPRPGQGEVLVRVYAAGIIAPELTWSATYQTKAGSARALPIPGHDLSGVVVEVGPGVNTIAVGSEVYALTAFDRDGAEAEYTIAFPGELAPKPHTLDHVQAAAVPLTALTAWQALFEHAGLAAGQTVLIHGAAGGVGVFAVQLARWVGAHVIATASASNHDFLRELGANEIIDYTTTRFEDVVHDVDLVFDTVGGDTLERSWQVVKKGGILVSVASPPSPDEMLNANFKGAYFTVKKALPFFNEPASIIFNGSVNALTGIANSSLYTANKGAIHALARALAAELIGRGIRVNTITIGPTATRLLARSGSSQEILQAQDVARISRSPVKRLGRPEEVANVALFLASDDSSFVVGSEIAADGGWLLNTM